jgi:hypothetical protein
LVFALIGSAIGRPKGRATEGFFLGLLLSLIGVIIIACVKPSREFLVRREEERLLIQQEAAARVSGISGPPSDPPVPSGGIIGAWREARRDQDA